MMRIAAMDLFGEALLANFEGDVTAEVVVRRDDGHEAPLPVSYFFREEAAFSAFERAAIERCRGKVLDVGAGSGLHSLVLQERGLDVTAIDVCPQAVEVMRHRGVRTTRVADIFTFVGEPFDTLLLMGHGIGMVETISGLRRLLARLDQLVSPGGQVLLDSLDVRATDDPVHRAYHEANRKAGKYVGEIRVRIGFRDQYGAECGWLQIDPETLADEAKLAGWDCALILKDEAGNHLSRLTRGS